MSIFGFIADLFAGNLDHQQAQEMEMTQQMEEMRHLSDLYEHPGTDLVVDESFHGIDHGMGIANPEHNFESMDDSFFGSSGDSFFGGGCGGDGFF